MRGLFAFDRGFWQDDANVLSLAHDARARFGLLPALVHPMGSPTRLLLGAPSLLAELTGFPVQALHVIHLLTWLGIGVAAAALVRTLFPGRPLAAFSAGALTICASSDFLTTSLVAAEYDLAVLGYVLFLVGALRFLGGGSWRLLAGGLASLLVSVYTIDVAALALVLAPILFVVAPGAPRRRLVLFAASGLTLLPYAVTFTRFMRSPDSYAAAASLHLKPAQLAFRALILLLNNVLPWQWSLDRPEFGTPPPRVVPVALWVLVAAICVALFAVRARRMVTSAVAGPRPGPAGWRAGASLAVLLAMAVASNIAFASVHFSDTFYRTHLLSRVFVSAGLGVAVDALLRSRRALLGWALAAAFAGFGAAGAVERQDYFLSSWRNHRRELASLLEAVPSVKPGTSLILFMPDDPGWHATKADYIMRAWVRILYDETPDLSMSTFRWTPRAPGGCRVENASLRCWVDSEKSCFDAGTCPGHLLRFEDLVVVAFRPVEGRYRLVLRGDEDVPIRISAEGYAPETLIGPPRAAKWRLLPGPVLARLLPAFRD
ncbi:MAG: hypothetical protein ABI768_11285 [Acidobacteriota bacterium]